MSSVTAVPLRPIERGSLTRLWLGVALVVVAALALAWAGTRVFAPLGFAVIEEGSGPSPNGSDVVLISYVGKLDDGKVFDQNPQAALPVEGLVKGFSQGLKRMKRGGHYTLTIPPALGYGARSAGTIPPNSTLHFDVKLLDFKSRAEIEQMQRELQSLQQQQQQSAPGAPLGAAPAPSAAP